MVETEQLTLGLDAAVLAVVACLTAYSVRLAAQSLREHPKAAEANEKYHDIDGTASVDSQSNFTVWRQNTCLVIFVTAGFVIATTEAVFSEIHNWSAKINIWLDFGVWVSSFRFFISYHFSNLWLTTTGIGCHSIVLLAERKSKCYPFPSRCNRITFPHLYSNISSAQGLLHCHRQV